PTPARTTTPSPTPSRAGTLTPTTSATPKPTPSLVASPTPTPRPTPPPLGGTTADRGLGQAYLNTNSVNFLDARAMNPVRVAVDRSATPNRIYVSDSLN